MLNHSALPNCGPISQHGHLMGLKILRKCVHIFNRNYPMEKPVCNPMKKSEDLIATPDFLFAIHLFSTKKKDSHVLKHGVLVTKTSTTFILVQ
jgi:hypothetical protein